ncbi:hypothetical protein TNCV_1348801 [Trichonephila clavipes]|nr:hypothetical protein TNCV_1348801 [Trichonephila clavipes]
MCRLGNTRPLPGHSSIGSINTRETFHPGVPPPTTESNKGGSVSVIWQNQVRRLPEVHPEHIATASGRGSNAQTRHPLSAALTLQQCLFGETEERYHQPIDRSGFTPASRLQRSVGQRFVVWTGKEEKEKWDDKKRVENREGSLGYPGVVTPECTKENKPLGKRKRSLGYLGRVKLALT